MRFLRFTFSIALVSLLLPISGAQASFFTSICKSLVSFFSETEERIPTGLHRAFKSAKVKKLVETQKESWTALNKVLDRAWRNEGEYFAASIGELKFEIRFKTTLISEDLSLEIRVISGPENGSSEFLELVAAQLQWVSENRVKMKFDGITIVGRDLRDVASIKQLESIGFERGTNAGKYCLITGLIGGVAGGGVGYGLFYMNDSAVEGVSIDIEEQKYYRNVVLGAAIGASVTAGILCLDKKGFNYDLEIHPQQLPILKEGGSEVPRGVLPQ